MSVLGDILRETAAACIRAAHQADGDFTTEIEQADVKAMRAGFEEWETSPRQSHIDDCFRMELRALIARGWRRVR